MNEFNFINSYLNNHQSVQHPEVVLGIGDDAAIVRPRLGYDWCFSTDMLIANRHFFAHEHPANIAHKILAVNLSDMAAMGATPRWILLSAALPELNLSWLDELTQTLFHLAQQHQVMLIGGDTTRGSLAFNITIAGELPANQALRRNQAKPDDDIWVSGQIGLAAAALQHHFKQIMLPDAILQTCENALLRPQPRVALGQALLPFAHAAIDISDGLLQDISHILDASCVGAVLHYENIPTLPYLKQLLPEAVLQKMVLAGGDDYELLFTAPKAHRHDIIEAAQRTNTPVSRIGTIHSQSNKCLCLDAQQQPILLTQKGYDHFA